MDDLDIMIPSDCVERLSTINSGAFGLIEKCKLHYKCSYFYVAVKKIAYHDQVDGQVASGYPTRKEVIHEVKMMLLKDHPNVVKCFGMYLEEESNLACMVLEYCEYGDLFKFLRANPLEDIEKVDILIQIAEGMNYLHVNGIVHRGNDGKIKICDFGSSKTLESIGKTQTGSPLYIAPERCGFTKETKDSDPRLSDIYSFGVIMWEVLSQKQPFQELVKESDNHFALLFKIHGGSIRPNVDEVDDCLDVKSSIVQKVKVLVEKCWNKNPNERPLSFDVIMNTLKECRREIIADMDPVQFPKKTRKNTPLVSRSRGRASSDIPLSPMSQYLVSTNSLIASSSSPKSETTGNEEHPDDDYSNSMSENSSGEDYDDDDLEMFDESIFLSTRDMEEKNKAMKRIPILPPLSPEECGTTSSVGDVERYISFEFNHGMAIDALGRVSPLGAQFQTREVERPIIQLPLTCVFKKEHVFYFEVKILGSQPLQQRGQKKKSDGEKEEREGTKMSSLSTSSSFHNPPVIGVGLAPRNYYLGMIGWHEKSIGLHLDDGYVFDSMMAYVKGNYLAKFEVGDHVGVGWDSSNNQVFFTKNGVKILKSNFERNFSEFKNELLPSISMKYGHSSTKFQFVVCEEHLQYKFVHNKTDLDIVFCKGIEIVDGVFQTIKTFSFANERATLQFPLSLTASIKGTRYFELELLSCHPGRSHPCLAVGLACKNYYKGMIGWRDDSIGYHGDDGCVFDNRKKKQPENFLEKFQVGDIVGCGWKTKTNEVFFTKNGKVFEKVFFRIYPIFKDAFCPSISAKYGLGLKFKIIVKEEDLCFNFNEYVESPPRINRKIEMKMCKNCLKEEQNGNVAFQCGHILCLECSKEITQCPVCKMKIKTRINL